MPVDKAIRAERLNYLCIALLVISAKTILSIFPSEHPMTLDPLLGWQSIGMVLSAGYAALYLAKRAGFYENRNVASIRHGLLWSVSLGVLTGVLIITISLYLEFPNIHIPFPHAIPAYFVAGSMLEFKLHLIPLILGTWLLSYVIFKTNFNNRVFWLVAVFTCLYEPYNQVVGMTSAGMIDELWLKVSFAIFIFSTNITPLVLFKKYGFLSFISYRFADYLVWHFVWPLLYFA